MGADGKNICRPRRMEARVDEKEDFMKYMGSKNKHSKELLPIILKDRKPGQWYVEPFVGGANMIDKVNGNRMGNDRHKYLIALLVALERGWIPPTQISEEDYKNIKAFPSKYSPELVGYAGFQLSYGAMWFGCYRRDKIGKRNYSLEAHNNVKKQAPKLKGIVFHNLKYQEIPIPKNSIIYCDPPYEGTAKYKEVGPFNHDDFWQWCRDMTKAGHQVFISEYNAPIDFKCIWTKEVNNSLTKDTGGKQGVEKLFIYDDFF